MIGGNGTTSSPTSTFRIETSTKESTTPITSSGMTSAATESTSGQNSGSGITTTATEFTSETSSNSPSTLESTVETNTGTVSSSMPSTAVTDETSSSMTTPTEMLSSTASEATTSTISSSPTIESTEQTSSSTMSEVTTAYTAINSTSEQLTSKSTVPAATGSSTFTSEPTTSSKSTDTSLSSTTIQSSSSGSSPTTETTSTFERTSESSTTAGSSTYPTNSPSKSSTIPSESSSSIATSTVTGLTTKSSSTTGNNVASSTTTSESTKQSTSPGVTSASIPVVNTMIGGNGTTSSPTSTSRIETSTKESTTPITSSGMTSAATESTSGQNSGGGITTTATEFTSETSSNSPSTLESTVETNTGTVSSSMPSTAVTEETSSSMTTPTEMLSSTASEATTSTIAAPATSYFEITTKGSTAPLTSSRIPSGASATAGQVSVHETDITRYGTDVTRASSSGTTPSATTEMPTTASVVSTDIFTIVLDKTDDGTSVAIPVSGNIPVYGTRYKQIHVSVNGLVSLGNNTVGYNPRQLPIGNNGTVLFAPLWTDFDIRNTSESSVFATVYQNVKSNTNITQEWRQYLEPGFNPTWALDVHWEQVCPFPAQMYDGNENTTFRLVLLTDGDRTLVAFDYDRDRALPYSLTRSPVIGLDFGSAGFSTFFNGTGTPEAVDVSTTIGNLGRIGKWLFKLYNNNDVSNATAVCRDWLMQESRDEVTSPFPACPCSTSQVFADPNFHFDNVTYCADRVAATNQGYGLHCCYNPTDTPIRGSLLTGSRGPSAFYRYHPEMYPALHQSRDLEARDACCTDDVTCEQYFSRRIVSSCSNYEPPIIAVAFGSPHLQTFDGLEYTFSGNEEYLMAETDTGSALHANMEPVWISDDPNQPNNSLTAFATFTFVGPTNISVSQNEKRTGIELTVAGKSLTNSFKRDSNFRETYNNLTVYKNRDDCVVIVETPGFSSTFCEAKGSISAMVVTPPDAVRNTRGLLGTANSNKSDDLSMRGSTDKPLPITSTDREIYSQMTSWSVSPGTNISLPKNETLNVTDVTPLFLDELYHDVYRDVNATDYVACLISDTVVSKACLYNRLILQDDVTANKTRAVADTIMTQKEVLQTKIPPLETGESRMLNVTVGEPMSLYLKHASSVHARCNSDINASCIDNTTGVMFTWTPVSLDTVHLSFAVEDPKLRLASETVEYEIQICDCSGHGTCRFDRLLSQSHPTDNFRLASCDCQIGWTGSHCELDFDGCQGAPCSDWGSNCTDLIPAEHQKQKYPYKCSECPSGYRRKGIGCFEIDECNENASLCDNEPGICFNTNGNYTCRCPRESAWNGSLCISYPELSTTIPESSTTRNPVDLCGYYNETHKCQNNGTCQLQNTNDSICVCTSGYHGDLCELPNVASARDGDWVVEILLPAAAAVAIAIATLCCILAVVRRRKKRSLDEESDQDSYGIRGSYAVPSSIFLPRFNTNWRQFYGSPSTWNDTAPTVHRERPLQFPITYPYDNETNSSGPENSFDDQIYFVYRRV